MSEFKRIPPEQAKTLREQGAVVVDIRDQPTYAAAHIAGANNGMDFHRERGAGVNRSIIFGRVDPDRATTVFCASS
jgi:rhodanese-related sulfurtransferase